VGREQFGRGGHDGAQPGFAQKRGGEGKQTGLNQAPTAFAADAAMPFRGAIRKRVLQVAQHQPLPSTEPKKNRVAESGGEDLQHLLGGVRERPAERFKQKFKHEPGLAFDFATESLSNDGRPWLKQIRRRPPIPMSELLIIKPSSLGDIVHGLQVATSLKAQCADLRISWIVRDIFAPLVRSCEAVDRVYMFRRDDGLLASWRMMSEVRATRFDYVFDFQGLLRTGLMTWRSRAARKIGRSDSREGAGFFYDEKVPLPAEDRRSHAIEILLQFCPVLGAQPELRGDLRFREVESLSLRHIEGRNGAAPIVIFPDSRRQEKRWGGFKQLTEMLVRDGRGRKIVWAGNNYVNDRAAFNEENFLNLTGNTSLVSLPALVQRADWVISNDSGPMHLAAAMNVRVLGIFGPTDPRLFGPYPLTRLNNHVIQAPVGDLRLLSAKDVYARFQRIDTPTRARPVFN
jgi:heptosyltransferase I